MPEPETVLVVWVLTFLGLLAGWFVLLQWLVGLLSRHHYAKFAKMGKPSLFWHNGNPALLNFLFHREHKALGDRTVSRLSDFLLASFVAIIVAGLLVWVYLMVTVPI